MKKTLFLTLIAGAAGLTNVHAQSTATAMQQGAKETRTAQGAPAAAPADAAAMLQQAKERMAPPLSEKTGLTLAQAERVVEINFEIRQSAVGLRDLSDSERSAKIAEMKTTRQKRYSEIPLTADQIKAVNTYYEDMGKNMPQKSGN